MSNDYNDLPNPFAHLAENPSTDSSGGRAAKPRKRGQWEPSWPSKNRRGHRQRAAVGAAKYLLAVIVCFAVLVGLRHLSGHWLLNRLTQDFSELSAAEQQQRLLQIEGLGKPAIPHLVDALAAKQISTARTAFELLQHSQNQWTTLKPAERQSRHLILADSISNRSAQLPDDRTGWAAALLQQSLMDSVGQASELEQKVYRRANESLATLSLSTRSGPSILEGEFPSGDLLKPVRSIATAPSTAAGADGEPTLLKNRRLAISPTPLPIDQDPQASRWSDWPPVAEQRPSGVSLQAESSQPQQLRPVEVSDPVILRPAELPVETAHEVRSVQPPVSVAKVAHNEDFMLDAYDDRSVMHWLVSPHAKLRSKATIELFARGYSERDLAFAHHMVHQDTQVRLAFLDRLTRDAEIDPRPWLWMMAEDESREVRLRVVAILGTMNDHAAENRLRTLMVQERDPTVAARIRRVLKLR